MYGIVTWRSCYDHAHRLALLTVDGEDRLDEALLEVEKARALTQTTQEVALTEGLSRTVADLRALVPTPEQSMDPWAAEEEDTSCPCGGCADMAAADG